MSEATKSKWGTIGTVACGQSAIGLVSAGFWNSIGLVAVKFSRSHHTDFGLHFGETVL